MNKGIDPVEFGRMQADVEHIKADIADIKEMTIVFMGSADEANNRIDTMEAVDSKVNKKMGAIYGTIAAVVGFFSGTIKEWM